MMSSEDDYPSVGSSWGERGEKRYGESQAVVNGARWPNFVSTVSPVELIIYLVQRRAQWRTPASTKQSFISCYTELIPWLW